MNVEQMSHAARLAVQQRNWPQVKTFARDILDRRRDSAEGYFLLGLAEGAANRREQAVKAFTRALDLDDARYDAAIELARTYMQTNSCGSAVALVEKYESRLRISPRYLDMAATVYTDAGLPQRGWPLLELANELQPGLQSLQANLAACAVFVGKLDKARELYRQLLRNAPGHQRYHYELSRLGRAKDSSHIDEVKALLADGDSRPEKNIYAYYALGKELEDLERWDEAFDYYKKAGDAATSVSPYKVEEDLQIIDRVIDVCTNEWIETGVVDGRDSDKIPIFVVGLPRTGTTLTERILSSHSRIESVGESYFIQSAVRELSGLRTSETMNPTMIAEAAKKDIGRVARSYREAIEYKFGDKPMFVEKFPENFLYLGFIAKAFPAARIVHLNRNPMDTCFAMYKQSFFRYAYSLDDLGPYYVAYRKLHDHWRETIGGRLVEVDYEALVTDQESATCNLLEQTGVDFEPDCLEFHTNKSASNTASTVQIREKIHARSVGRWKQFEEQLQPLNRYLEAAGIDIGA